MNFKSFLRNIEYANIRESPDGVYINGVNKSWNNADGVCFSLTKGICVFQKDSSKKITHDYLIASLLHLFYNGDVSDLSSGGVGVLGSVDDSNRALLWPLFGDKKDLTFNREKALEKVPGLIHGRLWKNDPKVISFWNSYEILSKFRNEILDFIKQFADPKTFSYDTNEGLMKFDEFMGSSSTGSTEFDASKLHTMAPSPERQKMMNMVMKDSKFGSRSTKYPDARTRASMSQSENKQI